MQNCKFILSDIFKIVLYIIFVFCISISAEENVDIEYFELKNTDNSQHIYEEDIFSENEMVVNDEKEYKVYTLKYINLVEVKTLIKDYFKNEKVIFLKDKNSFLVSNYKENTEFDKILEKIDIEKKQIEIDVKIVVINNDASNYINSLISLQSDFVGAKIDINSMKEIKKQAANIGVSIGLFPNTILDLELLALEYEGIAKVLSRPKLLTTENTTAYIESGEEIPYEEYNSKGGSTIVFKKAVLSLNVTPNIVKDKYIQLDIVVNQDSRGQGSFRAGPSINTDEIKTKIILKDQETISIGGILKQSEYTVSKGIPLLKDIPVFGSIFSYKSKIKAEKEMVIYVTPRILSH